MQPHRRRGESKRDFAAKRAILALALSKDPITCTIGELGREFGDMAATERAVIALEDVGLLEARGGVARSLWPTQAAREAHRLEAW